MPKLSIPPIEGERIVLRLLEEADLDMTLRWRNQDHIRKWFKSSAVISPSRHRAWFESYRERDDDYVFIIEERRDLFKPVGQVSLYRIDWVKRCAEFGRLMIGEPEALMKGIAKEATRLLMSYGLAQLELIKLELQVYDNNKPAIMIYRSCGFKETSSDNDMILMEAFRNCAVE
ncbi:MAG: GNAT family N-acetyltransferase [Syntrophobacteraceae bacterium]|jgi:diamine N-acetyltransferase|nr:GNAT family N-acetyltransferase [Syntrophobacteraceae bacterium]